jgi:hypothetical protein
MQPTIDSMPSRKATVPWTPARRLTWRGRGALALAGVHVALLFLPPIPPDIKGSLWSYLLAYAAVVLAALELRGSAVPLAQRWHSQTAAVRVLLACGAILWLLALGLAMRALVPALYVRWAAEEGVFEPLTLFAYISGGLIVLAAARLHAAAEQRHLRLVGAGFLLLAIEEIDYFGVFGGIIGRIDGVYVGSPHDLINLWSEGLLSVSVGVALAGVALAIAGTLWWRGYLQPLRLLRMLRSPATLWLLAAAVFIGLGAMDDLGLRLLGEPSVEELFEVVGSIFVLAFGLEVAGRAIADACRQQAVGRPNVGEGAPPTPSGVDPMAG